jgi:carbonic anhydrase
MNKIRRVVPEIVLFLLTFSLAAQQSAPQKCVLGDQRTPQATWECLIEGNDTFRKGPDLEYEDIVGDRRRTSGSQRPRATIVGCADSRVPPELVFHKSLGDLFVLRVAGNIVDEFALGSIEFAASGSPLNNWSNLVVVLGHSNCGAVMAALGMPDLPGTHLQSVLTRIRESFGALPVAFPYVPSEPPAQLLRDAVEANALNVVAYIRANSVRMRDAEKRGDVQIRAAYYDFRSGEVTPVPPPPARPR